MASSNTTTTTTTTAAASSPCCPPGSWEGPLNPTGPAPPKGITFTFPDSDLTAYYTGPTSNNNNSNNKSNSTTPGVVVFHDVWGHSPRLLSICDVLAERGGFHVIAPDCFRGKTKDDVPDMLEWLQSHPYEEQVARDIQRCRDYLVVQHNVSTTSLGALGFCWGGWAIAKSASEGFPWKVGASPHPSFTLESRAFGQSEAAMMDRVHMPLLLLPAQNDPDNVKPGGEHVHKLETKGGKSIVFDDMKHGFTTRSDLSDAHTKAQVEKALTLALDFLQQHLRES